MKVYCVICRALLSQLRLLFCDLQPLKKGKWNKDSSGKGRDSSPLVNELEDDERIVAKVGVV